MSPRPTKKRLGKKHRQASTRPKKGRAPRNPPATGAQTGAASPRKRKVLSSKRAEQEKKRRTPTRSPEKETHRTIASPHSAAPRKPPARARSARAADNWVPDDTPETPAEEARAWDRAEQLATQMALSPTAPSEPSNLEPRTEDLPLIAICGRPNVGKSTLFNRLTGSRRSIVGDEPGITRDRIYGLIDWANHAARLVDTGGIVPDDPDLIPAEIFRQAQTALAEADAIIMVIDGRTELASPDRDLARLLLRTGKPLFLAVNKIDTAALAPAAENFRRLGFRNVVPISAEHGSGIGDLLDDVFATLPEPTPDAVILSDERSEESKDPEDLSPASTAKELSPSNLELEPAEQPHLLRSHASFTPAETRIAIIGRPNVGKSTLLNALTGSDRAIVSPIAGTTRDAVDEVATRGTQTYRFVDTAGIRRKGKTRLMAEKLSVVMARKHLEAADVSLLVLDATAGVTALDATIGGYAHESGRSILIVVNKWDLVTHPQAASHNPGAPATPSSSEGWDAKRSGTSAAPADKKIYEQQIRDALKFLDYAPIVFISASEGKGIDALYQKIDLVARERRKRVTTGQMNRFLTTIDFQHAPVPLKRRIKIYYMTQAAVAPPTFVLFTDRDVPLHFAFERFLANRIRDSFGFIGSPIWFKTRPRNKKSPKP